VEAVTRGGRPVAGGPGGSGERIRPVPREVRSVLGVLETTPQVFIRSLACGATSAGPMDTAAVAVQRGPACR
jgi:hypothetical protein